MFNGSVLDVAAKRNLGFYNFCSVGNKADINELDLLRYWHEQTEVKVLAAYLEEIKFGYDFVQLLTKEVTKPVIIFKAGKTAAAERAIASHTGSLAGTRETVAAALAATGAIEATPTTDFFNYLQAFSSQKKLPQGGRIAILTNAGGAGIIATDEIIAQGLTLAHLQSATKKALKQVLPPASIG